MSSIRPFQLGLVLASLAFVPLGAQKAPNFSGTWVMVPDKTDYGPMPGPSARTDVIEQNGAAITIKRSVTTPEGEVKVDLAMAVDGKPHKNTTPQGELVSTLAWEGEVLVISSEVSTPNGPATIVDRMSLDAEGKTLTQKRSIQVGGQEIAQTIVLAKH
jgi:hypothetical protein